MIGAYTDLDYGICESYFPLPDIVSIPHMGLGLITTWPAASSAFALCVGEVFEISNSGP